MAACARSDAARERCVQGKTTLHYVVRSPGFSKDSVAALLAAGPDAASVEVPAAPQAAGAFGFSADSLGGTPLNIALHANLNLEVIELLIGAFPGAASIKSPSYLVPESGRSASGGFGGGGGGNNPQPMLEKGLALPLHVILSGPYRPQGQHQPPSPGVVPAPERWCRVTGRAGPARK